MIEEKVRKKIESLKQVYREKEKVYKAEEAKLKEYVEKYLVENDILNDEQQLEEVIGILPNSRIRDRLIRHLYGLELKEKEQHPVQDREQGLTVTERDRETGRISSCKNVCHFEKNSLKKIEHQVQIYQEKEKVFRTEQKKLHKYVEDYLDENDRRSDIKKLEEVIDVLPGGILRFHLIECREILLNEMATQQCIQEKSIETQKEDVSQVLDETQITDMGGIR